MALLVSLADLDWREVVPLGMPAQTLAVVEGLDEYEDLRALARSGKIRVPISSFSTAKKLSAAALS
ncbi:hypothetical protein AB0D08_06835 [Kitasatospora sp. NPDC048540]|uniref:hypothetical protein n=1 Tax=Kitasatospora sp. NPDC048540 TaxID=3155634 RepID=UPI0034118704